jgi:preprotein translocase subunit YajC
MEKTKTLILGAAMALLASVVLLGSCVAPEGSEGGSDWTFFIFLALMLGLVYLFMIRPQRRRQQEHQKLVEELKRGDKVVTAGGVYGVIESTSEDSVVIRVESGATMRVARGSVALKQEG